PLAAGAADGPGAVLDLGDGSAVPALPAETALVRVRASAGVSEARVMAALERVAAAAKGRGPTVIALTLAAPVGRRTPLSALVDRLVASGVGVVVGAGNAGPALGTVASPADSKLAVVVAAASADKGLQFYSSRGTPEAPRVTWTDLVEHLEPGRLAADAAAAAARLLAGTPAPAPSSPLGTAAAAERTAGKLAALAKTMADAFGAAGRAVPDGWFPWLAGVVAATVTPMPAHARHEVGAGLFDDESRARGALLERLKDLDAVTREAAGLAAQAREAAAPPRAADAKGRIARRALGAALAASLGSLPAASTIEGLAARAAAPAPAAAWWKDPSATREVVGVPLYALRREHDDPGVGKYTDLGRYYKESLAKDGADAVLLLPHFATLGDSPYAPVSLDALNEDNVDWSAVPEVKARPDLLKSLVAPGLAQSVDHDAVRARESAVARASLAAFRAGELARGGARASAWGGFLDRNRGWLDEYAEFMALSQLIGKPVLDWTADEVAAARRDKEFSALVDERKWTQWQAESQLKAALDEVHAAGGKVLFDVPMFRGKNSVDAWKRPEWFADLRARNPGIINAWIHEDWKDLALWRWSSLRGDGYRALTGPFERWLDFGFDGARVDAFHFAYNFGNGQLASGDEPGDEYAAALGEVFRRRGAFPLAEAFEGKDEAARRYGFVTVGGDWKKVSSHDDPRQPGFLDRLFRAFAEKASGAASKFVAWTLGDEWRDPFPVKEMRGGRSYWSYRIPLATDPDYASRARFDARPQLRTMNAVNRGETWADPAAVRGTLGAAADSFVKHDGGSVQIWAASMDWFLEEWGRDTFVSLPGLLLTTGRHEEAKENIRRFSKFEREGLIPNKIWDASRWSKETGDGADYNTSDAPMWFVQAVRRTVEATGDRGFAREMAPVVRRILAKYRTGTGYRRFGRFNRIGMDADGLVAVPAQSTWMDADPDGKDRPVTPRDGKPVEINALWYANLRFLADLERSYGTAAAAKDADALADKVKESFNARFWFATDDNRAAWGETGGALRDVVDGDPHGDAIRPNMVLAAAVGGDLLAPERRRAVLLAATKDLLTRYGLRTLSPRDSGYRARYGLAPRGLAARGVRRRRPGPGAARLVAGRPARPGGRVRRARGPGSRRHALAGLERRRGPARARRARPGARRLRRFALAGDVAPRDRRRVPGRSVRPRGRPGAGLPRGPAGRRVPGLVLLLAGRGVVGPGPGRRGLRSRRLDARPPGGRAARPGLPGAAPGRARPGLRPGPRVDGGGRPSLRPRRRAGARAGVGARGLGGRLRPGATGERRRPRREVRGHDGRPRARGRAGAGAAQGPPDARRVEDAAVLLAGRRRGLLRGRADPRGGDVRLPGPGRDPARGGRRADGLRGRVVPGPRLPRVLRARDLRVP
ncbi:MAG: 4-alpha-glucanotransferase, partial [Elusimicrobia bacterium]|nr:4-alpha-glucanotransferase [Elusimicrobiota bacterium]